MRHRCHELRSLLVMCLLALATTGGLRAQPTSAEPEQNETALVDRDTGQLPTLAKLFGYSPVINSIIAALSTVTVLLFVYFATTITTRSMMPKTFVDDLTKLVVERRDQEAADLCRNNRHIFIAGIVQRCLENAAKDHALLMEILETEGRRRADIVWNRISYLADVSNVAPMLGLLGTVTGMIRTFFLLPDQPASINSRVLSYGIGQAMTTTFFGLVVAITALVLYSFIKSRTTSTLAEVEQTLHNLADHLKRHESKSESRAP